jgi:hypothetical protein
MNTDVWTEALASVDRIRLETDDATAQKLEARALRAFGDKAWGEAIETYRFLLIARPEWVVAWLGLAACHEAQGDLDTATELYRLGEYAQRGTDEQRAMLRYCKGRLLLAQSNGDQESREALEAALRLGLGEAEAVEARRMLIRIDGRYS